SRRDVLVALAALIVPSEIFAARRVRWIFHREFRGAAVCIEIPSFEEDFTRAGWWKTKAGLITFQAEVSAERFSKAPDRRETTTRIANRLPGCLSAPIPAKMVADAWSWQAVVR